MNRQVYCGGKQRPPGNKVFGTPNECYLKGRKAGFVGGIQKGVIKLNRTELNKLRKDVIRSIAVKFMVNNYSNLSKEQLMAGILERAQRQNQDTFNIDDLKNY